MGRAKKRKLLNKCNRQEVREVSSLKIPTPSQIENWIFEPELAVWLMQKTGYNCQSLLSNLHANVVKNTNCDCQVKMDNFPLSNFPVIGVNALDWTLWYSQTKTCLMGKCLVIEDWKYNVWGEQIQTEPEILYS